MVLRVFFKHLYQSFYLNKIVIALLLALVLSPAHKAQGDTLFEGYFQILLGEKPVGYIVHRYEYDPKKKVFTSTYYNKVVTGQRTITESLSAKATQKFKPISYQYTSRVNKEFKIIDASFQTNKKGETEMGLVVSDGKKSNTFKKKVPKNAFLSTFLAYLMLNKGIQVGTKFNYPAIAEEDGEVYTGVAFIEKEAQHRGVASYKILNEFKGTKFISFMAKNGDVIGTKSPLQQVSTKLMKTAAEATKGFDLKTKDLKILFGAVPTGKKNTMAQMKAPTPATKPTDTLPEKDKAKKGS